MQSKGAIKTLAIAFALVCVFQLSFSLVTRLVERNAKKFALNDQTKNAAKKLANGDASKEIYLLDSISKSREQYFYDSVSNKVVYNLLIRKYTYKECKEREINLGLDLKGGMNVTMEVSVPDIVKALSNKSTNPLFLKAFNLAAEREKTSQKDFVTLFGEAFQELDPNAKLAAIFSTVELKDRVNYNSTNAEVLKVIRTETNGAIDRTFNILRTRIDRFGVTQPNIQKLSTAGRILVELPGIKEPERVRKLLQGTAQLEFWETYQFTNLASFFTDANKRLQNLGTANLTDSLKQKSDSIASADTTVKAVVKATPDKKQTSAKQKKGNVAKKDSTKTKSDLLSKIDSSKGGKDSLGKGKGKSFEKYAKENPLFAYLRPAFIQNQKGQFYPAEGSTVGYASIKDTATVNLLLKRVKGIFPRDLKLAWAVKPEAEQPDILQLYALKVTSRDGSAPLGGDVIVDARQDYDQNGKIEISMNMNSEGARIWKRLTGENVGKQIAIALDGYVYSAPRVNDEIPNGRSSISGNFSIDEAKDLANILKAGKLPAPARIVEENVVGPSLGKEAINAGMYSFIFAFIGVLLYMSLYYNGAGHVADIALFTNVFFLFGVLASLGAVLTLPGIAGIVLTLAMAVDSNVIIYERMREEIRAGKGARLAVKDGFHHAYSAIIDGHVTTILTGIVLYIFGSGTVQGFATTLIIGLLLSLFTSIFVARLVFEWMLDRNIEITVGNKYTLNAFTKTHIPFIEIRKIMYVASGILIGIGIISLFVRGLSYGIDFTGGRTYIVRFDETVNTEDLRVSLAKQYDGEAPEVKTFGASNQVKITTKYLIKDNNLATDSIVEHKLYAGVQQFFKTPIDYKTFSSHGVDEHKVIGKLQSQKVGPTIAKDLVYAAFMAVFFALIIIFIYIAIRFKNWQYGLGGVVSLAHDTMVIITMFTLFHGLLPFNMEVDQQFIAALLTIIGYSIMDSVIIFDRIREYTRLYPKRDLAFNIDAAINSTLGRTINTSGITLVVLIIIFIFGGEVLRGFVFALLVGVAIGTYSSVFNATPVAYDVIMWRKRVKERKALKNKIK